MKISLNEIQKIKRDAERTLTEAKVNAHKDGGVFYQKVTKQLYTIAQELANLSGKLIPNQDTISSKFSIFIGAIAETNPTNAEDKLIECPTKFDTLKNQLSNLEALHSNLLELIKIKEHITETASKAKLQIASDAQKQLLDTAKNSLDLINKLLSIDFTQLDQWHQSGELNQIEETINEGYQAFILQETIYRSTLRSESIDGVFSYHTQKAHTAIEEVKTPSDVLRETAVDPEREKQKTQTFFFLESDKSSDSQSISYE
ncbi:hypothetical protein L3V82_07845 [Thiotrichales bacterium 19S3-7]|nr:hypothetical protein [Thiotrichales bacterium 19S3-7]MCF6802071.1 hypothetical protein [Thiotrichales bacterium 19S3-11]